MATYGALRVFHSGGHIRREQQAGVFQYDKNNQKKAKPRAKAGGGKSRGPGLEFLLFER